MTQPSTRTPIRAVQRACSVLMAFSVDQSKLTLSQLAAATQLAKPTVYRLASTLVRSGLLEQDDDGRYSLGLRTWEIGTAAAQNFELVPAASAWLDRLLAATGEAVILAQADWDSHEVVVIDKRDGSHPVSVTSPLGARSSMFGRGCVARCLIGGLPEEQRRMIVSEHLNDLAGPDPFPTFDPKAVLDELDEISRCRLATDSDYYRDGVAGVSSWVRLESRWPVAAIAVVGPSTRLAGDRLVLIGQLVRAAAEGLSFRE